MILAGEHAVVHGRPALAASLSVGVSARARKTSEPSVMHISPWNVEVRAGEDEPLARAFSALLSTYDLLGNVELELEVDIPGGAGLGCSAAMGVAACEALDKLSGISRSKAERGEHTLIWERVFHGNPSGVDNMVSACGGVLRFVRGETPELVSTKTLLPLVIAHSGHASSTKEVVARVGEDYQSDKARVGGVFDAIAEIVDKAQRAIRAGDLEALGVLLSKNHVLLRELDLSTPKLDTLCDAAMTAGALGAKVTGAGAGGCMIALAKDMESAAQVEAALSAHSSMRFITQAGGNGVDLA